ncbi:hypothetical protein ZWY2020_058421 [Hordeum vulgare]|nr:hypothetical protein ZWY2020_058421 [Hordeum vulgare]
MLRLHQHRLRVELRIDPSSSASRPPLLRFKSPRRTLLKQPSPPTSPASPRTTLHRPRPVVSPSRYGTRLRASNHRGTSLHCTLSRVPPRSVAPGRS